MSKKKEEWPQEKGQFVPMASMSTDLKADFSSTAIAASNFALMFAAFAWANFSRASLLCGSSLTA